MSLRTRRRFSHRALASAYLRLSNIWLVRKISHAEFRGARPRTAPPSRACRAPRRPPARARAKLRALPPAFCPHKKSLRENRDVVCDWYPRAQIRDRRSSLLRLLRGGKNQAQRNHLRIDESMVFEEPLRFLIETVC